MAGMDYSASANLIRAEVWSQTLQDELLDKLHGTKFVRFVTDFPDGDSFTIPTVGSIPVRSAVEANAVVYDPISTGEVTLAINKYSEAATYLTDKAKQDMYYAAQLIGMFPGKMRRAIDEDMESSVFAVANSQTEDDLNTINGADHRFVASGNTNTTLSLDDFAKAKFALDKAGAHGMRVAIIDPSQEYVLNSLVGAQGFINNPQFAGIVNSGFVDPVTGLRFIKNIMGFDVYVSNYLATPGDSEIDSISVPASPKANIFMAVGDDMNPFVGAWRQMPKVEYFRNTNYRRDEYVMNARWGLTLYRPETLVTVISKSTI
jgi:hypothetical protein